MRSLFPKKVSVQDIEREVTEQLETMVRSGKNPPPASWTLLGGLHGNEQERRPADEPAPAALSSVEDVEIDHVAIEEERAGTSPVGAPADATAADEDEAAEPPRRAKAGSSRARNTGAKSGRARTTTASGGSTRARRSTTTARRTNS